ncbi:hypothetical protein EMPS_02687 [Entomortierella parvispora]|uniref:Uncharacterized protein n=1 Tax=Entomortierella parvispora TaxID=205924 RepID=A0A9P3H5C1_9FUNG|nr:hypothetical protein EMPS_02687 [Entomortierella parvispora]
MILDIGPSSGSYHRRSHSCLAVASHHEHYEHPSYYPAANSGRYYDTVEITEAGAVTTAIATGSDGAGSSASPNMTRHGQRKSETISMSQLQRSLSGAHLSSSASSAAASPPTSSEDGVVSVATGSLGGKVKLNAVLPTPRRSLLSDMLNSQNQSGVSGRLEQNANRRRMLKSMRRYSVDASEMNFNVLNPYTSPMQGIPAEGEEAAAAGANTAFSDTPTVRYLRNPTHATVKTKLVQGGSRRGAVGGEGDARDYFGAEDRVW